MVREIIEKAKVEKKKEKIKRKIKIGRMELLEEDERDEIPFSGIPDVISRYYIQYFFMSTFRSR